MRGRDEIMSEWVSHIHIHISFGGEIEYIVVRAAYQISEHGATDLQIVWMNGQIC